MNLRKKPNRKTTISTASLPDIVFLLLFFFMVSATIKPKEDKVQVKYPRAEALTKIDKKILIKELNIGVPKDQQYGLEPQIASENRLLQVADVGEWAIAQRETLPEVYKDQMIVLLKADEYVKMGLISDIQEELKKVNARKVVFRTLEE